MNAENIARIDAYCETVAAIARSLDILAQELTEMRDAMRGSLDPRQIPMPIKEAA